MKLTWTRKNGSNRLGSEWCRSTGDDPRFMIYLQENAPGGRGRHFQLIDRKGLASATNLGSVATAKAAAEKMVASEMAAGVCTLRD